MLLMMLKIFADYYRLLTNNGKDNYFEQESNEDPEFF